MNEAPKNRAAQALGRLARGVPKTITAEQRAMKAAFLAKGREAKAAKRAASLAGSLVEAPPAITAPADDSISKPA